MSSNNYFVSALFLIDSQRHRSALLYLAACSGHRHVGPPAGHPGRLQRQEVPLTGRFAGLRSASIDALLVLSLTDALRAVG